MRSKGTLVIVVDAAVPPAPALGSTEPYYLVVLFEHVLEPGRRGFVVAESYLEALPMPDPD